MKKIYTFTITTHKEIRCSGDGLFGADGTLVGRILSRSKVSVDEENAFFTYDIESTLEVYEKLRKGYKLYNIDEYSVHECSVCYTRN